MPNAVEEPKTLKPAQNQAEAVALLDEYARRLANAYPPAVRDVVWSDYESRTTTRPVAFAGRQAMAQYTFEEESPEILIEATIFEKSAIYLRVLLIHEALVHKAQHMMLLQSRGRAALMAQKECFRRVSELSAYAVEWDLAHLIPAAHLAADLRNTALTPDEISATCSFWSGAAHQPLEEHLGQCYSAYFLGHVSALEHHESSALLLRSLAALRWDENGLRPFAEITAVAVRARP